MQKKQTTSWKSLDVEETIVLLFVVKCIIHVMILEFESVVVVLENPGFC